jgi:hypothetical protein
MGCTCAARRGARRGFGQAQVEHLSRLHQLRHGTDRFLNRDPWVDAVLIVQVDMIDTEPLQTGIASRVHILRCSVDSKQRAIGSAHVAKLGGEHNFLAARFQDFGQQAFVGADAITIGRIEEIDADIERGIEHAQIRGFIGRSVVLGHTHAAEANGRDFEAVGPQFATWNDHDFSEAGCSVYAKHRAIGALDHYCRVLA